MVPIIAARGNGATFKEVSKAVMEEIEISFPSAVSEQERIAAILDRSDAIRRKRRKALTVVDSLLRATFLDMFGDPATNPRRLPTAPLSAFGRAVTGNTPPRSVPDYYGDEIEWIKSDNLGSLSYTVTTSVERLSAKGAEVGRQVPAGSTLVTCIAGSPESIGNVGFADRTVAFNQQINALTPSKDTDPHFLFVQFLVGKRLVQRASTNSMKGMVSKSQFEALQFLAPEKEKQRKFGDICRRIMAIQTHVAADSLDAHRLFGSLSQRAFRGEFR
jgi:type I restriction enzyme S subunit